MRAHVTADAAEFDAAAGGFLRADAVANTIFVAAVQTLLSGGGYSDDPPVFGWVSADGGVVGALMHTPPFPVGLSRMPVGAATFLGAEAAGSGIDVASISEFVGPPDVVHAFAAAAGLPVEVTLRETQYRLDRLVAPPGVGDGSLRPVGDADHELYVTWAGWFEVDAGISRGSDHLRLLANRQRSGGQMWLWEVGGEPVCLVGATAPVADVVRIGPVFTPRAFRRRGYGAAATAAACAEAFERGVRACTLFADAANETSNRVYRRIGFAPVGEIVEAVVRRR